jgi:hypothetical protein
MADTDHDLDRLLAEAGEQIQAPPGLQQRVKGEIDRSIRRSRVLGGSVVGAMVLVAAVLGGGWPPSAPSNTSPGPGGTFAEGQVDPTTPSRGPVEATFGSAPGAVVRMNDPTVFAAPVRSSRPNVTIVRVYRDTPAEEPSPESRNQSTPASEASVWTADFGE